MKRRSTLGQFKPILDVDPGSLEGLLPRVQIIDEGAKDEQEAGAAAAHHVTLPPEAWEKLTQLLKHELDGIEAPQNRLVAIQHVGVIYEHELEDPLRAFRWWGQVLANYPFAEEACEELERLAGALGAWRTLAQVYGTAAGRLDPARRKQLSLKLARVYLEQLDDQAQAERVYRTLLHRHRDDPEVLGAMERFYQHARRHEDLIEVLRRRLEGADTVEEQTELRLRLGYIYELELEDPDLAAEAYRSVLRDDPHNRQALEALEQIYLRQERWRELLFTYERMAAAAEREEVVVDLLIRMANIYDEAHLDRERSQQTWARVLELRGADPKVLDLMARRFRVMERWEELAGVQARRARLEQDPARRARLFEELGRTWGEHADSPREAIASWREVIALEPENTAALQQLADLHGRLGAHEEQLVALNRLIEIGETAGSELAFIKGLYRQVARLELELPGRLDQAIEAWLKVLRLDPDDLASYEAVEPLLSRQGRWAEAVQILELWGELVDEPAGQAAVLLRLAEIQRDGLGDSEAALRTFRRVLVLVPGHEEASEALRRLYQQLGRAEELVALIFGWLERIDDPRRSVELLQEAALLFEEQLDQPDKAFAVWLSAFKLDRMNEETRAHLEQLAAAGEQIGGRWDELLGAFEQAVKGTTEARVKVSLLVAMGRWYARLGQPDLAAALANQSLHMAPESLPALEVLADSLRTLGRTFELVPVLKRQAEVERSPERVVGMLCEMAELWQSKLGDSEQAIATYQRALQICPADAEALGAPLAALEALYRGLSLWEPLVGILQRQIQRAQDAERVISLWLQIGETQRRLLEPTGAIAAYRAVLALDPHNLEAMEALQALYDNVGESEAYLDILEQQIDHLPADDAQERVAMYGRIAAAWREQFDRADRAVACLEKLLELDASVQAAYVSLERLHREGGNFERLVRTYERHIDAVDAAARIELQLELGDLFRTQLGDASRAVAAYEAALALDPEQERALEALAGLHERSGRWVQALEILERLSQLAHDAERSCALRHRIGRIHEDRLQDPGRAEACYEQALSEDGAHFDSMVRLIDLLKGRADWARAAAMMIRAEGHTTNDLARAQLLHEAGLIHLERLDDQARGVALLARTLEIDPDHLGAGLPLARILFSQGAWERLEPILDMLARKVSPREKLTRHEISFWLGRTATALDKIDKAIRAYKEARAIDANHLPTLQALAALQFRTADWGEAFKTYQTILVHHRPDLSPDQVLETFYQLGNIKAQQGEGRKALNYYDKALEEDPHHRHSLEAVIALQSRIGDWRAVAAAKQALLTVVDEPERLILLTECGDLFSERLNAPDQAIEAYQAAVALRPADRVLLHRLLELLSAAARWDEALRTMLRIAEVEPALPIRARYYYTAGILCRDELDDADRATALFNETLDCAPDQLKAFEAIDRICTERRDWAGLERNYRKMIQRTPDAGADPKLLAMLWHNLGEVYRTRMKRTADAITAFEQAVALQPDDTQGHEILAELYERSDPQQIARAIAEHQTLLAGAPLRTESLLALRRLYAAAGQSDSAFCVAAALRLLGQAKAAEQQIYQQRWQHQPRRINVRIPDAVWQQQVLHPGQDRRVGELLAAIAPTLMELTARQLKEFGLKRKQRIKPAACPLLVQTFEYATAVLGVISAERYSKHDQQADLMVAHTAGSPTMVVGDRLLTLHSEKELAFIIGQQLTYLRPELYLSLIFPSPAQLRTVLLATVRLCQPTLQIPAADAVEVDRLVQRLQEPTMADPGLLQRLSALAQQLGAAAVTTDLGRWLNAAGLTAHRMGLILCDDLEVAARIVRAEPSPFGMMPASDKVRELIGYGVSTPYFELRRALGLGG